MQSSRTVLVAGEHPTVHGLSAAMQHLLSASSVAYMYLITAVCIIEVTLVHTGNSKHIRHVCSIMILSAGAVLTEANSTKPLLPNPCCLLNCSMILSSAGAVLTKANLTKSLFPNPTQYKTARYPRILLTTEELQEVRSVQPKGVLSQHLVLMWCPVPCATSANLKAH